MRARQFHWAVWNPNWRHRAVLPQPIATATEQAGRGPAPLDGDFLACGLRGAGAQPLLEAFHVEVDYRRDIERQEL
jgi:hypothetical protein